MLSDFYIIPLPNVKWFNKVIHSFIHLLVNDVLNGGFGEESGALKKEEGRRTTVLWKKEVILYACPLFCFVFYLFPNNYGTMKLVCLFRREKLTKVLSIRANFTMALWGQC